MLTATIIAISLAAAVQTTAGRHLVFADEFDKPGPVDTTKWHFDDGPVYNNELEKYASTSGKNAWIEKGHLVIQALKEDGKITSARLTSLGAWKYGYIEARAMVPVGKGTWPAIWMLNEAVREKDKNKHIGWPACGEIDNMENVGADTSKYHFSLHSEKFNFMKATQRTTVIDRPGSEGKFHVFGVDWRPGKIRFFYDGEDVGGFAGEESDKASWPFSSKFFIILNLAIGGSWGGYKGVDDSIFPSRYLIDYVRVYQSDAERNG